MEQPPIRSAFADDPDLGDLVKRFVADLPARMAGLQAAAQDDAESGALQRLAHQMRGAAGGYGFPQLTEAAGRLEDALRQERRPEALRALEELLALCRRAGAEAPS